MGEAEASGELSRLGSRVPAEGRDAVGRLGKKAEGRKAVDWWWTGRAAILRSEEGGEIVMH